MAIIDKVKVATVTYTVALPYTECTTAAATAAKTVTMTDVTLAAGTSIRVKFTNSNTAANPTLSVNGGTAISIKAYGTTAPTVYWKAGTVVELTYDGTNFVISNYGAMPEGSCTVSGGTLSKGTASGGGLSGGGLTASSGEVSLTSGAGSASLSGSNVTLSTTNNGISVTATGSGSVTGKGRGSVNRASVTRAAFSQTVTRADIKDAHAAGYIPAKSATTVISSVTETVSLAADSSTIGATTAVSNWSAESSKSSNSATATKYITAVTVPKDVPFSVTTTADTALDDTSTLSITNNTYRKISIDNAVHGYITITNPDGSTSVEQPPSATIHNGAYRNSDIFNYPNGFVNIMNAQATALESEYSLYIDNKAYRYAQFNNAANAKINMMNDSDGIAIIRNYQGSSLEANYNLAVTNEAYRKAYISNYANAQSYVYNSGTATVASGSSSTGNLTVNAYNSSGTAENNKSVVSNGKWVQNTITPSTSAQGPFYGRTTVNAVSSAAFSNITTSTASTAVPLVTTAGYTGTNKISGITVPYQSDYFTYAAYKLDNINLNTTGSIGNITVDTTSWDSDHNDISHIDTIYFNSNSAPAFGEGGEPGYIGNIYSNITTDYDRYNPTPIPTVGIASHAGQNFLGEVNIGHVGSEAGTKVGMIWVNKATIQNLYTNITSNINDFDNSGTIYILANGGTITDLGNSNVITSLSNWGTITDILNEGTINGIVNTDTISLLSNDGTITECDNSGTMLVRSGEDMFSGNLKVTAANPSSVEEANKSVVSNGKWVQNTVTPSTSAQGPFYGRTTVSAMPAGTTPTTSPSFITQETNPGYIDLYINSDIGTPTQPEGTEGTDYWIVGSSASGDGGYVAASPVASASWGNGYLSAGSTSTEGDWEYFAPGGISADPQNWYIPKALFTTSGASVKTTSSGAGYIPANTTVGTISTGSAKPAASLSGSSATASLSGTTLTLSKTISNTPQVTAGYISAGTAGNTSVSLSGTVPTQTKTATANGTVSPDSGKLLSSVTVAIPEATRTSNATWEDRLQTVPLFSSSGYHDASTYPGITSLTIPAGRALSSVTLEAESADNYGQIDSINVDTHTKINNISGNGDITTASGYTMNQYTVNGTLSGLTVASSNISQFANVSNISVNQYAVINTVNLSGSMTGSLTNVYGGNGGYPIATASGYTLYGYRNDGTTTMISNTGTCSTMSNSGTATAFNNTGKITTLTSKGTTSSAGISNLSSYVNGGSSTKYSYTKSNPIQYNSTVGGTCWNMGFDIATPLYKAASVTSGSSYGISIAQNSGLTIRWCGTAFSGTSDTPVFNNGSLGSGTSYQTLSTVVVSSTTGCEATIFLAGRFIAGKLIQVGLTKGTASTSPSITLSYTVTNTCDGIIISLYRSSATAVRMLVEEKVKGAISDIS